MTQAEYMAYEARRASQEPRGGVLIAGVDREKVLHGQIIDECTRRGWLIHHGSMSHRTYRGIGEADFIIALPGARTVYVECKSRTGKQSPAQKAYAAWLGKLGHKLHLVRSMEEFLAAVA